VSWFIFHYLRPLEGIVFGGKFETVFAIIEFFVFHGVPHTATVLTKYIRVPCVLYGHMIQITDPVKNSIIIHTAKQDISVAIDVGLDDHLNARPSDALEQILVFILRNVLVVFQKGHVGEINCQFIDVRFEKSFKSLNLFIGIFILKNRSSNR
jgi:hypothetical protein